MAAVILAGGAAPPDLQTLHALLASQPDALLIGVDRGALYLIEAGLELDHAVGDFDSVSQEEFALIQAKSRSIHRSPAEKDDTDMELALVMAMEQTDPANTNYYLFGAITSKEGRLDHLIANLWLVYQPRFQAIQGQLYFMDEARQIDFLTPGCQVIHNRNQARYLSIISLTPVEDLVINQAKYTLAQTSYTYPRALISNEFMGQDPVEVSFKTGLVMVILEKKT